MKRILFISGIVGMMLCALASCAPEQINHPSEANAPVVGELMPRITVDDETNQVTFCLPEGSKAMIPIWIFQDKNGDWNQYTAQDELQKIFAKAGDYVVRMKIMTSNGISADYAEATFHVANTIMNFDKYVTFIAGATSEGSSKEWRVDNSKEAHLACGPSGTNGTEWWRAKADEKKDFGMYDNRMTFTSDYTYTFDPGEAGTVYVNIDGVTDNKYTQYKGDAVADYNVPAAVQTVDWTFDVVGDDLYIVLPAGTSFPYIANDKFINDPRIKVESMTAKAMELVYDNGDIAWHFSLTSGAAAYVFNGYKYNAESNLWKPIDDNNSYTMGSMYYAHGGNWADYPEGSMTYTKDGGKWTITLPYESDLQWQAQFHIVPASLPLSASTNYDFSCIINSSTSFKSVTVKLTDVNSDANYLFEEKIEVKAYEDIVFYRTDLAGIDASNAKLVFDFGGCRENTEMVVKNITLKDHAIDDGTVLPSEGGEDDQPQEEAYWDVTGATNLWRSANVGVTYWYSAGDWLGTLTPEITKLNDYNDYKVIVPEGIGGNEWQGQTHFTADIAAAADKLYDFCVTLNSSTDCTVTVKLAWEGNDNDHSMFYVNDFKLTAFEDCVFKMPKIAPDVDYDKLALFIDLGRTAAGSEVIMKDFCFQEHQDPKGGSSNAGVEIWDYSQTTYVYWYSAGDWQGTLKPEITPIANGWSVVIPEGIGGTEWQGQTHFTMPANVYADRQYNFSVVLNSSTDCVCTVKLAWEGNDNDHAMFYENSVALKAYEDVTFEKLGISPDVDWDKLALFVDLGRTAAGSTVEIKNISLKDLSEAAAKGTDIWDNSQAKVTYWFSAGDWQGTLTPEISTTDKGWKVVIPEGIGGNEWQGQTHITMPAPVYAAKTYDFSVVLNSSADCVCTVKLAWEGNDNDHAMFYENSVALKAYEDVTFEKIGVAPDADWDKLALFVDLGRTPAGSEVTIESIHLYEK